jgi:hypothetical protein
MSFRKPIDANVSQRFGVDFMQNGKWYYKQVLGYLGHNGDDYAAPAGTPVFAADEGIVAFEGWGQLHAWMGQPAGICVLINNGGVYSGYAHLSSTLVNKGQRVVKGQQIGTVGATGAADGPHLHFEVLSLTPNFKNGYAGRIDPQQYMEITKANQGKDEMTRNFIIRTYLAIAGVSPSEEEINFHLQKSNPESFINGFGDNFLWKTRESERNAARDDAARKQAALSQQAEEIESLKKQGGGIDAETLNKITQAADNTNWLVETFKDIFRR